MKNPFQRTKKELKIKKQPDLIVELLAFVVLATLAFAVIYIAINFQSLVEFREF